MKGMMSVRGLKKEDENILWNEEKMEEEWMKINDIIL